MLTARAKGTEGNLFPLWSKTNSKITFDESMNKHHWCELYSWPRTSIREKHHCKTRHNLPGRRNPLIFHGAHGKNTPQCPGAEDSNPLTWSQKFSLLLWQVQIVDDIIQVPLSQQVWFTGRIGYCKCWITTHIVVSLAYIFITWLIVTQRHVCWRLWHR